MTLILVNVNITLHLCSNDRFDGFGVCSNAMVK